MIVLLLGPNVRFDCLSCTMTMFAFVCFVQASCGQVIVAWRTRRCALSLPLISIQSSTTEESHKIPPIFFTQRPCTCSLRGAMGKCLQRTDRKQGSVAAVCRGVGFKIGPNYITKTSSKTNRSSDPGARQLHNPAESELSRHHGSDAYSLR